MTSLEKIAQLNEERYGLTFNADKAIEKLKEELEEFIEATNIYQQVDALSDIIVIAAGELRKLGYDPEKVLYETIKEISSRIQDPTQEARWKLGKKEPGEKWKKWKDQPVYTLYEADYTKTRIKND